MVQIQLRRQERSSERKNWREEKEQKVLKVNSNAGTFAIDYQRNFRNSKGWKLKKETYIKSSKGWLLSNLIASKKQKTVWEENTKYRLFDTCIFKNSAKFLHCPILPRSLRIPEGTSIWNRRGCSSEIFNLTPKGDHLGVAQAFCDP